MGEWRRALDACNSLERRLDAFEAKMRSRKDSASPAAEPAVGSGSAALLEQSLEQAMLRGDSRRR